MPILSVLALWLAGREQTVTVFAAASLKESFTEIARDFEAAHPGTHVRLSFAGSQMLAAQINQGAPADVFASADERNLRKVKLAPDSYRVFAENRLAIVYRRTYRTAQSVEALANAQRIVVANQAVPVGEYTVQFLDKAQKSFGNGWRNRVDSHIVSREQDVRAVLTKVQLGEADAGVVYVSDAYSAAVKVARVDIADSLNIRAIYPIGVISGARNAGGANQFVDFVLSPKAQTIIASHGLTPVRKRRP